MMDQEGKDRFSICWNSLIYIQFTKTATEIRRRRSFRSSSGGRLRRWG